MTKRWNAMVAKESNGKTFWTQVGAMWENKAGTGFNLVLDAIPAPSEGAYRISLFEPKENNSNDSNGSSSNSNRGNSGNSNSSYSSGRPGANRNSQPDHGQEDDIPF